MVVALAQPVVGLEDAPALRLGDTRSVIDHGDAHRGARARGVHADGVVGICAAGVLEEVHENLPDHRLVHAHGRELSGAVDVDVDELPFERRRRIVHGRVEQFLHGHHRAPRVECAGLDAGQVEHVVDESREAPGLVFDAAEQRVALVLGHVFVQCRSRRGDCRQRRAEVVRHGLQERAAQPIRFLERLQHDALVLEARAPEREAEDAAERLQHGNGLRVGAAMPGVDGQVAERDPAVADRQGEHAALAAQRDEPVAVGRSA